MSLLIWIYDICNFLGLQCKLRIFNESKSRPYLVLRIHLQRLNDMDIKINLFDSPLFCIWISYLLVNFKQLTLEYVKV